MQSAAGAANAEKAPPRADVIVIDDDESMCRGCQLTLDEGGYSVTIAQNGADGLRLVEQHHPSVVLVDLKMPGISGEEVLKRVTQIDANTVSIVITGFGTVETAVETMKIGAFDFLAKPFEPERLLETVQRAMKLSRQRRDAAGTEAAAGAQGTPASAVDRQTLLLQGLEVLGNYYSLGFEKRNLLEQISYLESEAKYHSEQLGVIQKKEKAIKDVVDDLHLVDSIIERYGFEKGALLQVMLQVQLRLNWMPRHVLRWIAERLNVPLSRVYTIAEFYEAFSLEPRGKHLVQVCLGTACHVRRGPELLARVSAALGVQPGQTDTDREFTLKTVHCMGCCALAPVMKIDNKYFSNPSLKDLKKIFKDYKEAEEAMPCRN